MYNMDYLHKHNEGDGLKQTIKTVTEIRSQAAKDLAYQSLKPRELKDIMVLSKDSHLAFHFRVYRDQKTGRVYESLLGTLKEVGWEPPKKEKSQIIKPAGV